MAQRRTRKVKVSGSNAKPSGSNFNALAEIWYGDDCFDADYVDIWVCETLYVSSGEGTWASKVSFASNHSGNAQTSVGDTGTYHGGSTSTHVGKVKRGTTVTAYAKGSYTGGSGTTYSSEATAKYTVPKLSAASVSVDKAKAKVGEKITVTVKSNRGSETAAQLWSLVPIMNAAGEDKQPVADWVTFDWKDAAPGSSRGVSSNDETQTFELEVPYQFKEFKYLCLRAVQYQEYYGNYSSMTSATVLVEIRPAMEEGTVHACNADKAYSMPIVYAYDSEGKPCACSVYAYGADGTVSKVQ